MVVVFLPLPELLRLLYLLEQPVAQQGTDDLEEVRPIRQHAAFVVGKILLNFVQFLHHRIKLGYR
jgi:hypothetical protein